VTPLKCFKPCLSNVSKSLMPNLICQ
jgi:hypothetical protein